jgi:hypothetical protein
LTVNGVYFTEAGDKAITPAIYQGLFGVKAPDLNLEKLRAAVNEKNAQWHARYRTVDGYNVYGGRSQLVYNDISNYKVMQEEMSVRDTMTANRDHRVWGVAQGRDPEVDDSNLPPVTKVPTNKKGDLPDGSYSFLTGEKAIEKMTLHPHLKVNLFASEEQFPELANPVQMAWDTKGRLWVAVWPNYPERTPESTKGDSLIGINTLVWLFVEEFINKFLNLGHSCHTTDEEDLINLILGQARILESHLARLHCSLNKLINNLLKLCSGDLKLQMLGA